MDANGAELPGVVETGERPRLAGISALVDAAPGRDIAARAIRTRAHIDDVGIGVRNGDGANRPERDLPVAHRFPVLAVVRRLEHAAAGHAHVKRGRLRRHAGHGRDTAAARGTDAPVLHALEQILIDRPSLACGKRGHERGRQCEHRGAKKQESGCTCGHSSRFQIPDSRLQIADSRL